ncbi:MAG: NrsF family protein [Tagaea sp.]
MNRDTEKLIDALSGNLRPVRPLDPPMVRAGRFLAFAAVCLGAIVLLYGVKPLFLARLDEPAFLVPWLASILTGIAATIAVFHLAVPGAPRFVFWLPVPPLAVWLATLGAGCLEELLAHGAAHLETSWHCVQVIVQTSVPLGLVLGWMLRRAAPLAPVATGALAALAVAAFASATLETFHSLQTATMLLLWHVTSVGAMTAIGAAAGKRTLRLPV